MVLKATQSEAVEVLLTGPPGSELELELLSVHRISKVVSLRRVALCLNTVSWARAVLPLRIRRLELEEPSKALSENECTERDDLVAGEACYLRICGLLRVCQHLPRSTCPILVWFASTNSQHLPDLGMVHKHLRFSCPKVKGIPKRDVLLLSAWLAHLRTREKHLASLKMLKVKPTFLPSIETADRRSKARSITDIRLKKQKILRCLEVSRPDATL